MASILSVKNILPFVTHQTCINSYLHLGMRFSQRGVALTTISHERFSTQPPPPQHLKIRDTLDLTFNDARQAYRSKSTWEILRAWLVLKLCSVDYLVENNDKLMKVGQKVLGKNIFGKMMEATFYGHFVAGPDQVAIQPRIQHLREHGVKAILDYSVEEDISEGESKKRGKKVVARTYFYMNEAQCERNMEIFLQSIEAVSGATKGAGFAAIKLTALGRPELLISQGNVGASRTKEEMLRNMMRRLHTIFKTAKKLDVRVMVDAEQSYFQPTISRLAMEMSRVYNTEKAIIFNTYQCYLKDAHQNLCADLDQAERENIFFGAKLVRGAYMEQERLRAKEMGYEDPINPDFEASTEMYERNAVEVMTRMKRMKGIGQNNKICIMMATHNEDTIRFVIKKMKEIGIKRSDRLVCFGQLYGMCDQVSFPLGQSGYSVYKYVPYGPVTEVLPYLSRRAQENRGFLKKIKKETSLLRKEFFRRITKGQLFYRPKGHYEPL